ncbi:MAG: hypothetical protein QNJ38_23105 [Prochloraceae cyanobacterium]|nr:hypothetical protein [Prochloraceae cyanobacterium]
MINFNVLELRVNPKYSFVGIQLEDSKLIFHLPKGFKHNLALLDTYEAKCNLFFDLYNVLNKFKAICLEKGYLESNKVKKVSDRDGMIQEDGGLDINKEDNNNEIIFYSKFDALASILNAYDELKILSLVSRQGRSQNIDYSKLDRYLHEAVFLKNNAIYLDSISLPRRQVNLEANDIVLMYCYLLTEIKDRLKQKVSDPVKILSENFRQKYLNFESSLFSEQHYEQIIGILKDTLETIDRYTPIRDFDYWDFYEAIEKFLYGKIDNSQQGKIWGINNFYMVWESMCLTYLVKNTKPNNLLYLDCQYLANKYINSYQNSLKALDLTNVFEVNNRKLYPDAVILSEIQKLLNYKQLATTPLILEVNHGWNDNGYRTQFLWNDNYLRIAYKKQVKDIDTFKKMKEKQYDGIHLLSENEIEISFLPKIFYSYWEIEENLKLLELKKMFQLNHVFFVACQKKLFKEQSFFEYFDRNLGEVFYKSLFRKPGYTPCIYSLNEIYDKFIKFRNWVQKNNWEKYFIDKKSTIEVIDIKYSDENYYLNTENIEEIKSRSVRKQFVYEYLIQKHLESSDNNTKLDIESQFWLPSYSDESNVISSGAKYLDFYIKLINVDIMAIMESYINS